MTTNTDNKVPTADSLKVLPLAELKLAASNMRHGKTKPDVSDLVPDIQRRGILQPLCVRPNCEGYEVVAGRRRFFAATEIGLDDVPCMVREDWTDAEALEASYAENFRRLDPDPLTQYETFAKLVKLKQTPAEIADAFGLPELTVKRRLAIGNLIPAIRDMIRADELRDMEIQALTLATEKQQREWVKLAKKGQAPRWGSIRRWVLDGGEIDAANAIFDRDAYTGPVVSDLFGDTEIFTDTEQFWTLQNAAIAALVEKYEGNKWTAVHLLEKGEPFYTWEAIKTAKKAGGHVYIQVGHGGEVIVHEGWLTRADARKQEKAKQKAEGDDASTPAEATTPKNPELSTKLENYVVQHKARAVGEALSKNRHVALRYAAALLIRGNANVAVHADQTPCLSPEIEHSVSEAAPTVALDEARGRINLQTGIDVRGGWSGYGQDEREIDVFAQLLDLTDKQVIDVIALALADRLEVGGGGVEVLGELLEVDMRQHWTPDDAFFELVREKATLGSMLAEVAGKKVADANVTSTGKAKKAIIHDCLDGTNGREKVAGWLPRWFKFPVKVYDRTTGVRSIARAVDAAKRMKKAVANA